MNLEHSLQLQHIKAMADGRTVLFSALSECGLEIYEMQELNGGIALYTIEEVFGYIGKDDHVMLLSGPMDRSFAVSPTLKNWFCT